MKTVKDIMIRRLIVLSEEENLARIEEGMGRFGLRHLPVVDDGKLVGLVSHRDLLRASVSSLEPTSNDKNARLLENTFVREIMTQDVKTVRDDTPLIDAARILVEGHFGCLPVIDSQDVLVGIVTEYDFLELTVKLLEDCPESIGADDSPDEQE